MVSLHCVCFLMDVFLLTHQVSIVCFLCDLGLSYETNETVLRDAFTRHGEIIEGNIAGGGRECVRMCLLL